MNKLTRKANSVKYWFQGKAIKFAMFIIYQSVNECNVKKHAEQEFKILGWLGNDEMQTLICKNVIDLLVVFSAQGHSGTTAPYVKNIFKKLVAFEPISPLTGKDSEWIKVDKNTWQNNRYSSVFKNKDGKAYNSNGKVFREPDGCHYTSRNSRVYINFPYEPKTEYVDVDKG